MGIIEEYLLENSKIQIADDYIQEDSGEEIWKEVCKTGASFLEKEGEYGVDVFDDKET